MKRSKLLFGTVGLVVLSVLLSGCLGLFGPKLAQVSGTVKYESGDAVVGAQVKLGTATATTNASGAFSFKDIEYGSYTLTVNVDGDPVHSGQLQVNRKTQVVPEITIPDVIYYGTVAGTVTTESDDPVEGAMVSIPALELSTTTSATGAYSLPDVMYGSHAVTVTMDGTVVPGGTVVVDSDEVTHQIVVPDVIEEAEVTGSVVDEAGDPVEGAIVSIVQLGRSDDTDAAGTFAFDKVVYGTYQLTVSLNGTLLTEEELVVDKASVAIDIEVELPQEPNCEPLNGVPGVYCLTIEAGDTLESLGWHPTTNWKIVEADGKHWIESPAGDATNTYIEIPGKANANRVIVEYTTTDLGGSRIWGVNILANDFPGGNALRGGTNFWAISWGTGLRLRRITNNNYPGAGDPAFVESAFQVTTGVPATYRFTYDHVAGTVDITVDGERLSGYPWSVPANLLIKGEDHTMLMLYASGTAARWTDIKVWAE